jgi:hypothetical protein
LTRHADPKQKQLSREEIHALCGSLKRKPGEKPFAEQWAEYKREEIELEDSKLVRMNRAGLLPATRNSSRSKRKSNQLAEIASRLADAPMEQKIIAQGK